MINLKLNFSHLKHISRTFWPLLHILILFLQLCQFKGTLHICPIILCSYIFKPTRFNTFLTHTILFFKCFISHWFTQDGLVEIVCFFSTSFHFLLSIIKYIILVFVWSIYKGWEEKEGGSQLGVWSQIRCLAMESVRVVRIGLEILNKVLYSKGKRWNMHFYYRPFLRSQYPLPQHFLQAALTSIIHIKSGFQVIKVHILPHPPIFSALQHHKHHLPPYHQLWNIQPYISPHRTNPFPSPQHFHQYLNVPIQLNLPSIPQHP